MVHSMTAFARSQSQGDWGSLVCELRSINHRYLEFGMRLPDAFHPIEAQMRERIREHIKRGKVECFLRYQSAENNAAEMIVNKSLVKKLSEASELVMKTLKNPAPVNPIDILRWPGILQIAEVDFELLEDEIIKLLDKTLHGLVEARRREGTELKQIFLQRLDSMKKELAKVRERIPSIMSSQRERLMTRFTEANLQFDALRLEQEMVLFAQKTDVMEELERLDTHIAEVQRVLESGGAVGRRLDFLMQELNREANTLGAKSVDTETTRSSVELKVLIEQMREQVQNVE